MYVQITLSANGPCAIPLHLESVTVQHKLCIHNCLCYVSYKDLHSIPTPMKCLFMQNMFVLQ